MLVNQGPTTLIQEALRVLDVVPGDQSTLGHDVDAGMQKLVALVNGDTRPADRIQYDPTVGYTPALGQQLLAKIGDLKASSMYKAVENAYAIPLRGRQMAQGALSTFMPNAPIAIQNDPGKLFDLVDSASDIVAALDSAHAAGQLTRTAPVPIPPVTATPTTPVVPGAPVVPVAPPPPTVTGSTFAVELLLQELAPVLNAKLEESGNKTQEKIDQLPEGFIRDMANVFKDLAGGSFLDLRIPVVAQPDGVFDWKSQASLQGLLTVLGHPKAMNFRGDPTLSGAPDWLYTPEKGQFILNNLEALKKNLSGIMTPEELAGIEPMLARARMEKVVQALDFLHGKGLITDLYLFENHFEAPVYMQNQFQDRVNEYQVEAADGQPKNLDMLRLMDGLTRQYAGPEKTLLFIMPGLAMQNLGVEPTSDPAVQKQQLLDYYKAARARHQGTSQEFSDELFVVLNTVITLPFGKGDYRQGFNDMVEDAVRAAGAENDPARAAEIFAQRVTDGTTALIKEHGEPGYVRYLEREAPVWKPGLANMPDIASGGRAFSAQQIAQAYDDFHVHQASRLMGAGATSLSISHHTATVFRDDAGDIWVAAVNRDSMIFSIEKIDIETVTRLIYQEGVPLEERRQQARDIDKSWAMIDQEDGPFLGGSIPDMLDFMASDRVPELKDFAKANADMARNVHQAAVALEEQENARPVTYVTGNIAGANAPREMTRAESIATPLAAGPGLSPEDISRLGVLRDFTAASLYAVPLLITPDQSGRINLLKDHAGQALYIGTNYGSNMPILGVDMMVPETYQGPVMAWYDTKTDRIKVVEPPADLLSVEGRAALQKLADFDYGDPITFLQEMRARPALYQMVADQQVKLFYRNARPRLEGEPLTAADQRELQVALQTILSKAEQDLRPSVAAPEGSRYFDRRPLGQRVEEGFEKIGDRIRNLPNAAGDFAHGAVAVGGAYITGTVDAVKDASEIIVDKAPGVGQAVLDAPGDVFHATKAIGGAYATGTVNAGREFGQKFPGQVREVWDRNTQMPPSREDQRRENAGDVTAPATPSSNASGVAPDVTPVIEQVDEPKPEGTP